ncbi:helix-turn-helix transcriptional regulator [Enterobacter asburiae]|uniref:helix-turn-helix transcriptional regulator n=1 Tax=Enterobacter asburiae TaxID=61645 RepID=UPI003C1303F4
MQPATGSFARNLIYSTKPVSTIDRKVRNGSLPRPVKLGEKITAFDAVEIHSWLAERREKVA